MQHTHTQARVNWHDETFLLRILLLFPNLPTFCNI